MNTVGRTYDATNKPYDCVEQHDLALTSKILIYLRYLNFGADDVDGDTAESTIEGSSTPSMMSKKAQESSVMISSHHSRLRNHRDGTRPLDHILPHYCNRPTVLTTSALQSSSLSVLDLYRITPSPPPRRIQIFILTGSCLSHSKSVHHVPAHVSTILQALHHHCLLADWRHHD
jgi:hypothetical protein